MQWLGELWRRILFLKRRNQADLDLQEELAYHLESKAGRHQADGMDPADARRIARREFGNLTHWQEESREALGWGSVERAAQDLRYAARLLRKNAGFTAVALATLALGIGANTILFTVVRAVLLAPLPYRQPERLVDIKGIKPRWTQSMAAPDVADMQTRSTVFDDVSLVGFHVADFSGWGEPERLRGKKVSANLFSMLGVNAYPGRALIADDGRTGAPPVVVLSYQLWQRRFGGTRSVIGQAIRMGKESRIVVGVAPPWFELSDGESNYWVPIAADDPNLANRGRHAFNPVARLKEGVDMRQASAEVKTIAKQLEDAYPDTNKGWSANVSPLADDVTGGVRQALLVLFGAVGMVLLVACANVANLLLTRGVQRRQEIALRTALGAGRGRLVRLLLAESALLSLLGGAAGVALAMWGVRALVPLYPAGLPRAAEIAVNPAVLGFNLTLSVVTAVLVGLVPALRVSRTDLNQTLKSATRSAGPAGGRLRGALVVAQVALAMVLLAGSGLLIKSFLLRTRLTGIDAANVVLLDMNGLTPARVTALLEHLRSLPGVVTAGATTSLSYVQAMGMRVYIPGRPQVGSGDMMSNAAMFEVVTPGYFQAVQMPLRKGRVFDERDKPGSQSVVVSEGMVRRYFPDEDPIGKQVQFGGTGGLWTIIGVVGDVGIYAADYKTNGAMYLSYTQFDSTPDTFVVRTAGPPRGMISAVRSVARATEPNIPIARLGTMRDDLASIVASPRFYTVALAVFAGFALGLAVLGVYGVVSFAVNMRTHEIGVRLALGATTRDVLRGSMREGVALAVCGAAVGIAASLAVTRLLLSTNLLFHVKPSDPLTLACVALALIAAAIVACWMPARRAAKVDPAVALRYE